MTIRAATRAKVMRKVYFVRELKVALSLHDQRVRRAQERLDKAIERRTKVANQMFLAEHELIEASKEGIN